MILFFAFGGMECAFGISGEIKDPKRTIPRGIMMAAFIVFIFYHLRMPIVFKHSLDFSRMSNERHYRQSQHPPSNVKNCLQDMHPHPQRQHLQLWGKIASNQLVSLLDDIFEAEDNFNSSAEMEVSITFFSYDSLQEIKPWLSGEVRRKLDIRVRFG